MNLNLWRAEWLKTRKRPANLGILILMAVIISIAMVAITGLALWNGDPNENFLEDAQQALPFPHAVLLPINILSVFGVLLSIVFVANTVGSEYGRDTWKMILPRQGSRISFLMTKMIVGAFALLLFVLIMIVFSQLLGWIGAAIVGLPLTDANAGSVLADSAGLIFRTLFNMVFYGTFALIVTVLARSTIFGIIATFIASALVDGVSFLSRAVALALPSGHVLNLQANIGQGDPMASMAVQQLFKGPFSVRASMIVLIAYMAFFIVGACLSFKRRDMAGG